MSEVNAIYVGQNLSQPQKVASVLVIISVFLLIIYYAITSVNRLISNTSLDEAKKQINFNYYLIGLAVLVSAGIYLRY